MALAPSRSDLKTVRPVIDTAGEWRSKEWLQFNERPSTTLDLYTHAQTNLSDRVRGAFDDYQLTPGDVDDGAEGREDDAEGC